MISLGHIYGGDLQISASGLACVSGEEATKQRVLRGILTNSGGYVWHYDYGAGLPRMVGNVVEEGVISAAIRQSLAADAGVDSSRPIEVSIIQGLGGVVQCVVSYFDKISGNIILLKENI
ncbi:phage tail protein [Neokomagataea anthophila]|uniref:Phage tail protein n=1 Tax=Neokomagataea anthophila TaxID=2826925 RepID=A0ABS5E8U8_9PROT|nr:phage tail protein [Neokomagataea anthophila]MBR0560330.1 phage tail protein [Neokomagataea anthophila]